MQMRAAYQGIKNPSMIPSFHGIHAFHKALLEMGGAHQESFSVVRAWPMQKARVQRTRA